MAKEANKRDLKQILPIRSTAKGERESAVTAYDLFSKCQCYLNCHSITLSHRICYANVTTNCKVVCQCLASDDATPPPIRVSVHSDKPLPKIAELPHRATFIFLSAKYTFRFD